MTIELTRKHLLLFISLFAVQTAGLLVTFSRSPLVRLPFSFWAYFFLMVAGSAFLSTIILVEILQNPKD